MVCVCVEGRVCWNQSAKFCDDEDATEGQGPTHERAESRKGRHTFSISDRICRKSVCTIQPSRR